MCFDGMRLRSFYFFGSVLYCFSLEKNSRNISSRPPACDVAKILALACSGGKIYPQKVVRV